MKHKLFLLLFLTLISLGHAQREITGKVTDESDIPLAGVTVILEGTTTETVTDFDGNYSIEAEEGQHIEQSQWLNGADITIQFKVPSEYHLYHQLRLSGGQARSIKHKSETFLRRG